MSNMPKEVTNTKLVIYFLCAIACVVAATIAPGKTALPACGAMFFFLLIELRMVERDLMRTIKNSRLEARKDDG